MDLTGQVVEAITAWLGTLTAALFAPAFAAVGQFLFSTPVFDQFPEVQALWSVVRALTNALFVLAVLLAGILVMTASSIESRYSAKVLIPRLVLGAIGANASLALAGGLIGLNNALVQGLLGVDPGGSVAAELAASLKGADPVNQYVGIFIGLWAANLSVLLVALYIGRDLALLVGIVVAPFALALFAVPQTAEIARLWVRAYSALLFVQVVQAALVLVGLEVVRHSSWLGGPVSGLTNGLVLVALLFLLLKLPFAAYEWAFRQGFRDSAAAQPFVLVARAIRLAA